MKQSNRTGITTGIVILVIAGGVTYHTMRRPTVPDDVKVGNAGGRLAGSLSGASVERPSHSTGTAITESDAATEPDAAQTARKTPPAEEPSNSGPQLTKAGQRDATPAGGPRKIVIDPLAAWKETPPWPEGPHLLADVETSGKHYVNLRPNDKGLMPRLNVSANETLSINLSLPDSDPGSSIHVELPNGGHFPDESSAGKLFVVSEKRTVSFVVDADGSRGFCTVNIRQAGHTRCLPLWVGEPEALASGDTD